jgi:predicted transglutaminase-like protease
MKRILNRIAEAFRRLVYDFYCFLGSYPTSDEIENSKIKSLASRLKAGSYEETLTNILEWENRNIEFWTERHPIPSMLIYHGVISGLVSFIGALSFVFLVFRSIQPLPLLLFFAWFWVVSLVSGVATILATVIVILHSNRKIPWKEVPRGLWNVFWPRISMEWLLENKLGVCRDYAKLTACLLINTYPNEQIYFATAPGHVATGIMIKDNLYMLDQRLPILTMDKWRNYRNARAKHKVEKFTKESLKKRLLKKVNIICLPSTTRIASLDPKHTKELAMRMTKLLKIEEQTRDSADSPLEILWKKGVKQYEDNELVNYSLATYLKMRISSELIRINQITRIEIERHEDDLMFLIRFSQSN